MPLKKVNPTFYVAFDSLRAISVVGIVVLVAQIWIQPYIARRVELEQQLWDQRRLTYFDALGLVDRKFDSLLFGSGSLKSMMPEPWRR